MLQTLGRLLDMERVPVRIEAYDISNLGKEHITAGMVVAENGRLKKRDYRTFSIRTTAGIDDYGAMREALYRRLLHLGRGQGSFSQPPDLILLDGGAGHVSSVRALLSEMNLDIPVYGMVKDSYHKTRALSDGTRDISIAREQSVYVFIYGLQEEVHRFAVSRMSGAKRKTLKKSVLENISGIGPAKAKKYLRAARGLSHIKNASASALEKMGIPAADAQKIAQYFAGKQGEKV